MNILLASETGRHVNGVISDAVMVFRILGTILNPVNRLFHAPLGHLVFGHLIEVVRVGGGFYAQFVNSERLLFPLLSGG